MLYLSNLAHHFLSVVLLKNIFLYSVLLLWALLLHLRAFPHDEKPVPKSNTGFIANKGQWVNPSKYLINLKGAQVFIEPNAFQYFFEKEQDVANYFSHSLNPHLFKPQKINRHAVRVEFDNALKSAIIGQNALPHYYNFFNGNNPDFWKGEVPSYARLIYSQIYPGISMHVYTTEQGGLKYDFNISPKTSTQQIKMRYTGANKIKLQNGNLIIKTSINEFIETKPYAYQIINGIKQEVVCDFTLKNEVVSFVLGDYNPSYNLTIDPELVFSTYSGSSVDNFGHTATYDNSGNLYTAGIARNATDFPNGRYPTTSGAFQTIWGGGSGSWPQSGFPCDIAISKYNNDGTALMYATYLGGEKNDYPLSLVADPNEQLLVLGVTLSANFPVSTNGAYRTKSDSFDITVTRFTASGGALIGSTYLGGNGIDGINIADSLRMNYSDEFRGEIQLTPTGDVVLVSSTTSNNIPISFGAVQPTKNSLQDGVVFKLDAALTMVKNCTYLGKEKHDALYSLDVFPNGDIAVAGGTQSIGFSPTSGPGYRGGISDAFIVKLNSSFTSVLGMRYWGSTSYDQAHFIKLDQAQNVLIMGQTYDSILVTPGTYYNSRGGLFISKLSSDLNTVIFSTQIGNGTANNALAPSAFMVDVCGRIYGSVWAGVVNFQSRYRTLNPTGFASSTNGMPFSANAFQATTDGSDFYLFVLSPNADSLNYATFFGELYGADHVDGGTSRFDKRGIMYQSVCASCNDGIYGTFPTTPGSYSPTNKSPRCSNATFKFDFRQGNVLTADFKIEPRNGCGNKRMQFINNSHNATKNYWYINDVLVDSSINLTDSFNVLGTYTVKLKVQNALACNMVDSMIKTFTVQNAALAKITVKQDSCGPTVFMYNQSTSGNGQPIPYIWYFGDGDTSTLQNPVHFYNTNGFYNIRLIANPGNLCADTAFYLLDYSRTGRNLSASFLPLDTLRCAPNIIEIRNNSENGQQFFWYVNNQLVSQQNIGFDTISDAGIYRVKLVVRDTTTCQVFDTLERTFSLISERYPVFTEELDSCSLKMRFTNTTNTQIGDTIIYLWNFGDGVLSSQINPTHKYADTGWYTVTLTTNAGFPCQRSTSKQIRIDANNSILLAKFNITTDPICEPIVINAFNNSINATKNYWHLNQLVVDSVSTNFIENITQSGNYELKLVVYNPLTCALYDTLVKPFTAYPSSDALFTAKKDSCSNLVIFTNQSVSNSQSPIAYLWNFGDGQTSTQINPTHVYTKDTSYVITLITNPNTPCADTASTTIDYRINSHLLTADFLLTDSTLCAPAYFSTTNTSTNGKYFYWYLNNILVNNTNAGFGDTLKQAGKFTIKLVVVDSNTCKVRDTLEKNIVVNVQAYADFIMQRDSCSLDVVFKNLNNTNKVPLIWRFGDGDSSEEFSPRHQYAVTGTYKVSLIFNQENFCADTAENVYFIDGDSGQQVMIPNVFTPNNDGINDCYQVTGVSQKCDEYHILIFNRWGIPIYENTNGNWCWDGKNQGGEDIPQGVYYYIITIKKKNGYQRKDHGTITLIRDN